MSGTPTPWNTFPLGTVPLTGGEYFLAAQNGASNAPVLRYPGSAVSAIGGPFLPKAGGTLTGPLLLAADPTAALGAATKQYVDGGGAGGPFLPLAAGVQSIAESGAVGDGVTDDQPVIQAWLNTLTAGAEVLLVPGKFYYIGASPLTIPNNIIVRGACGALDNQLAQAGTFFDGGGFFINPALSVGIIMSAASALRSLKVYRSGLVSGASSGVATAAYAAWTAEAGYYQTNVAMLNGDTLIPLSSTTGITTGMQVSGLGGLQPSTPNTVVSINPGVSVTISTGVNTAIPSGTYFRFGPSIGISIPYHVGGVELDELTVVGFRTGIQTCPGEFFITRCHMDCITNIECFNGGDTGAVRDVECLPLYGTLTGNASRQGDGIFVHDGGVDVAFNNCYVVGWLTSWHVANILGGRFSDCGGESFDGAGQVNWYIEAGAECTFDSCHAQTGSIGFWVKDANIFALNNCSSANGPSVSGNNVAHFYIDSTTTQPMYGILMGPNTDAKYPQKAPILFSGSHIFGVSVVGPVIKDMSATPSIAYIQGALPAAITPPFLQGVLYHSASTGGTTALLQYQNGLILDSGGTLATYTITLPAYPMDGQIVNLWFNAAVTALTVNTSDGASVANYPNPLAGANQQWVYNLAQTTWYCGGGAAGGNLPLSGGTVTGATTFSAAGTALSVTNNATIGGTMTATGAAVIGNSAGTGALLYTVSAAGHSRFIYGFTGGFAGANLRWEYGVNGTDELGSNAGSDWAINAFDDSGGPIGTPIIIKRSTLEITMAPLQQSTSFANDAAAAAGGVTVGALYRNGSVVQIRVSIMPQWLSYPTFSGPFSGQEQLLAASSTSPGAGMIRIPWSVVSGAVTGSFLPLSGGALSGPLTLAADPTTPLQAATKEYVDGFLPRTGGTMTGPITLSGNATLPLQAVPLQQLSSIVGGPYLQIAGGTLTGPLILAADPVTALGAATKQYADNNFLFLSGGTLSGPLVLAADPLVALGAATKEYVDNASFLPLGGGTVTGPIVLPGNATLPLQAVPLQQVNSIVGGPYLPIAGGTLTGALILAADPTASLGAATKHYVDVNIGTGPFLPLAGGAVTGATTFSAAGTALTVTNNATVGNVLTVGSGSQNILTVTPGAASANTTFLTAAGTAVGFGSSSSSASGTNIGGYGPGAFGWVAVANTATGGNANDGSTGNTFNVNNILHSNFYRTAGQTYTGSGGTIGDIADFSASYAGNFSASPAVVRISVPSDTTTGSTARGLLVQANFGGGSGGGLGRLAGSFQLTQTGAVTSAGQQSTALGAAFQSSFNSGGTGVGSLAGGDAYAMNPQVLLLAGATYYNVANALGEADIGVVGTTQTLTVSGSVTAGDVISLTFTNAAISGSPVTVTYTTGTSQTIAMVANNLQSTIWYNTALNAAGVSATVVNQTGSMTLCWPLEIGVVTVTKSVSGAATEILTLGSVVPGASADTKLGMSIARLTHDTGPPMSNSFGLWFGDQPTSPAAGWRSIIQIGGAIGQWPLAAKGTLISANNTSVLDGVANTQPISSPFATGGIDFRDVNFTQQSGNALLMPGFRLDGAGNSFYGSAKVGMGASGLAIDSLGWTGSGNASIVAHGGAGGGVINGNYYVGEVVYDDLGGQHVITGVNPANGGVTSVTTVVQPSGPAGSAPASTRTTTGEPALVSRWASLGLRLPRSPSSPAAARPRSGVRSRCRRQPLARSCC